MSEPTPTTPPPPAPVEKPRTPRPKKIRGDSVGPFATEVTVFDAGHRKLDVTVTARGIYYHAARSGERYFLPHGVGYDKAAALRAGVNVDPRQGRITRNVGGTP